MTWNDATAISLLIEQLEGLRGEPVELADGSCDLVVIAADRARRSRKERDILHLFRLVWQYPAVRRQPWVAGVKPYIAWRLYGSLSRIIASILACDLLDNSETACGWGRDEKSLWVPDLAFRPVVDDLDLATEQRWRTGHPLPELQVDDDLPTQFLDDIAGTPGVRCMLHRPGHWCSAPGHLVELQPTPGVLLEELLTAYRRRPGGAMATPVTTGYAWLVSLAYRMLPSLRSIMQHPVPALQAFREVDGRAAWARTVTAARQIPDDFRWLVLLHPTESLPLPAAFSAFLIEQLGRYLTNGIYLRGSRERAVINDPAHAMQRVELLLDHDASIWIDAVVVPVLLSQLGFCAESAALSLNRPRWRNPSWQDLTADWGLGPLLAAALPTIRPAESTSPNASSWWLAVPEPLDEVIRAACASPNPELAEVVYPDEAVNP